MTEALLRHVSLIPNLAVEALEVAWYDKFLLRPVNGSLYFILYKNKQ